MSDNQWDETDDARKRMLDAAYERDFKALGVKRPKFHDWTREAHEKEIKKSRRLWHESGLWDERNNGKSQEQLERHPDVFEDYGHIGCKKILYPPKDTRYRKPKNQSKNDPE